MELQSRGRLGQMKKQTRVHEIVKIQMDASVGTKVYVGQTEDECESL